MSFGSGSVFIKVKSLLVSEWCCAIRFNEKSDVSLMNDSKAEFTVLKNSIRYWTADPFLISNNGKYYVFFEAFDRLKRKGLLGYREITGHFISKIHICYECENHLSYPFIFEDNGKYYIIPESFDAKELFVLECVHFPDKWKKTRTLLKVPLVDTTLLHYNGRKYFFSQKVPEKAVFDRVDLFYEKNGKLCPCKKNPVIKNVETARGAGKFFEYDGKIIRPSQNCGQSYGEKLNFNEVVSVSTEDYSEKHLKTISVSDIATNSGKKYGGIHTYNKIDNIEVIDLKIERHFNVLNLIGTAIKRIKLLMRKQL